MLKHVVFEQQTSLKENAAAGKYSPFFKQKSKLVLPLSSSSAME
jgi:hypothetical protein